MELIVLLSQRKHTLKIIFTVLFKIPDRHTHTCTCNPCFSTVCLEQTVSFIRWCRPQRWWLSCCLRPPAHPTRLLVLRGLIVHFVLSVVFPPLPHSSPGDPYMTFADGVDLAKSVNLDKTDTERNICMGNYEHTSRGTCHHRCNILKQHLLPWEVLVDLLHCRGWINTGMTSQCIFYSSLSRPPPLKTPCICPIPPPPKTY